MNGDETGLVAILEYNKAPLASAQQIFFGERAEIDRSFDRRTIYGSHNPPNPPAKNRNRPNTMNTAAMNWPTPEAIRVARTMLPVNRQAIARSTRPPSSGYPGIMLKTASAILI